MMANVIWVLNSTDTPLNTSKAKVQIHWNKLTREIISFFNPASLKTSPESHTSRACAVHAKPLTYRFLKLANSFAFKPKVKAVTGNLNFGFQIKKYHLTTFPEKKKEMQAETDTMTKKNLTRKYIVSYRPGGVLPYMGYIGMCRPIGYGFWGSRSLNRVSFFLVLAMRSWRSP